MNIELKAVVATVESEIEESEEFPFGGFVAVASTPSLDRDGDKLERDEWIEPLPDHITIDIDHEMSVRGTVGSARPYFNENGQLMIEARFASTTQAQETRTLVQEGHIRTVSVAFLTDKSKKSGEARRELLNVGIVAIPSNRDAVILDSKDAVRDAIETGTVTPAQIRSLLSGKAAGGDASLIQAIHDAACHLGAECCVMDELEPVDDPVEEAAEKSVDAKSIPGDITIDEFRAALDSFFQTTPPESSPVESPVDEAAVEPVEVSAPAPDAADDAADAVAQRARLMAMSVLADSVLASEN
jgi:phage head maturation protease